jgi:putative transposase
MERWNQSIKSESIRPGVPLSVKDAEHLITQYVQVYNEQRLHSALGYVTPQAILDGRRAEIHAARDQKLELARRRRARAAKARTVETQSSSSSEAA